LLAEEEEW
jgi:hypothetical protein